MVELSIDAASTVPPFEQLRRELARQIAGRVLPVGTKLPTVRMLAADLGLAVNTVARAYRELETAGLIETRGRAGTFVGAGGDNVSVLIHNAAREYAAVAHRLGLSADEALGVVRAALGAG